MPTATRLIKNVSVCVVATGVVLAGSPAPADDPAERSDLRLVAAGHKRLVGQGEERRRIVPYVVRPGDSATALAVRFHAWTAELLTMNGLTYSSTLQIGQRLRIPVVPKRLRDRAPGRPAARKPAAKKERETRRQPRHRPRADHAPAARRDGPSRARVARAISRAAHRYDVDPELALAVSWQEAGWQMHHVSSAGAIGAMQVLRPTGAWMSLYVGRRLDLHRLRDNAAAGVMLLRVLRGQGLTRRQTIGGYYQGIGAVQRHGLYPETRHYVRNVLAIKHRLEQGRQPG